MNILLWILQVLLALHTITGAVWKFSNSEQTVAPLAAIPHAVWLSLSIIEILCSLGLVLPALIKRLAPAAPIAAACIAAEMVLFSVVLLLSGASDYGPMAYWIVVAAVSGFVAYGRFVLRPL